MVFDICSSVCTHHTFCSHIFARHSNDVSLSNINTDHDKCLRTDLMEQCLYGRMSLNLIPTTTSCFSQPSQLHTFGSCIFARLFYPKYCPYENTDHDKYLRTDLMEQCLYGRMSLNLIPTTTSCFSQPSQLHTFGSCIFARLFYPKYCPYENTDHDKYLRTDLMEQCLHCRMSLILNPTTTGCFPQPSQLHAFNSFLPPLKWPFPYPILSIRQQGWWQTFAHGSNGVMSLWSYVSHFDSYNNRLLSPTITTSCIWLMRRFPPLKGPNRVRTSWQTFAYGSNGVMLLWLYVSHFDSSNNRLCYPTTTSHVWLLHFCPPLKWPFLYPILFVCTDNDRNDDNRNNDGKRTTGTTKDNRNNNKNDNRKTKTEKRRQKNVDEKMWMDYRTTTTKATTGKTMTGTMGKW